MHLWRPCCIVAVVNCGELWCAVCQECVPVVAVILFLGLYFFLCNLSFIYLIKPYIVLCRTVYIFDTLCAA